MTIGFQATRASSLASATATSFGGLRRSSSPTRAANRRPSRLRPSRTRRTSAAAPSTGTLRNAWSPALVITPDFALPAVEWSFGVRPIQAANRRPDRNASGAGVFMAGIVAPIGPMPGIRAKRRLRALAREILPARSRPGWDYVLVGRPEATIARDFAELRGDLEQALARVHEARAAASRKGSRS